MSSCPGTTLEEFLMWSFNIRVEDEADVNFSLHVAEMLGTTTPRRILPKEDFANIVALFESERDNIEYKLDDYDEDSHGSWRDYGGYMEMNLDETACAKARGIILSVATTHGVHMFDILNDKVKTKALFEMTGHRVHAIYKLENQYSPDWVERSWWMVMTDYGPILIGPRKRVVNIGWEHTGIRGKVTDDSVTSEETYVHAYTTEKIIEYLRNLLKLFQSKRRL